MMNEKFERTRKLLSMLNDLWDNEAYYDDDLGDAIIPMTEEDIYEVIMAKDKEIHLLGTKYVKAMIHMMLNDWSTFVFLSTKYRAY